MSILSDGLVVPALVLSLMGWLVPRGLARVFPEGVRPLLALAAASAAIMLLLGIGFFVGLDLWLGRPFALLLDEVGVGRLMIDYLRLGTLSALLWGPILVLAVASLPRRWTRATW